MLNDLYFKTTCHIPHLLGPMVGLKIEGPLYIEMKGPSAKNVWSLKTSSLSCQWSLKTGFAELIYRNGHCLPKQVVKSMHGSSANHVIS